MLSSKYVISFYCVLCMCVIQSLFSQNINSDSIDLALFEREEPLKLELSFDFKQFIKKKHKDEYLEANLVVFIDDSSTVSDTIRIRARGEFRRRYCQFPPIRLNFKKANFEIQELSELEKVKLVTTCRYQRVYQQYLFQEYLIYKTYNLLTDRSFKVRMVDILYKDTRGKKEPFRQFGFIIEEVDRLAERNDCFEIETTGLSAQLCEPYETTLMTVFQYMIGNTDFLVNTLHNVKLVRPTDPLQQTVFAIPYDFDYSGMVNAIYAIPHPELGISSVRERLYRGYCFPDEIYESVFALFQEKKGEIYTMYETFPFFNNRIRRESIAYLDDFYRILDNPNLLKRDILFVCDKNR